MNLHLKDVLRGKVVNKRLTFNTGMEASVIVWAKPADSNRRLKTKVC